MGIEWYIVIFGVFITLGMVAFIYFTVTVLWWLIQKVTR